ncbi:MAG: toxin-antitoxin system HicB family antitoxin [bacterium]
MSALSLRLPNSLHERARELARREGLSINQLVSAALAEKMSALLTEEYLEARARRSSRARFLSALAQVPAVEPDAGDVLSEEAPNTYQPSTRQVRRSSPSSRARKSKRDR